MSWVRRLLAHFGHHRVPDEPAQRAKRVIDKADRVLADYRRQDVALRLVKVPKR